MLQRLLVLVALVSVACSGASHTPPGASNTRSPRSSSANTTVPATSLPPGITAIEEPWHLPAPLSREVVLPDGADLVILGGLDATDHSVSGVWWLDPSTGGLAHLGALPMPTHDAGGAVVGGTFLVFAGGQAGPGSAVQAFSGTAGRIVGHLPTARSDLSAVAVGGVAYVLGGYDGTRPTPEVLATTDGTSFHDVAALVEPLRYSATAVIGTTVWVIGGEQSNVASDAIQTIDTVTGVVRRVASFPVALSDASALVLGGYIFVAGGVVGGHASKAIWRLDPSSGTVTEAGQLPVAITDAGSAVVGGNGYLIGGENPRTLATVIELAVS